jgi:hypothetical protein
MCSPTLNQRAVETFSTRKRPLDVWGRRIYGDNSVGAIIFKCAGGYFYEGSMSLYVVEICLEAKNYGHLTNCRRAWINNPACAHPRFVLLDFWFFCGTNICLKAYDWARRWPVVWTWLIRGLHSSILDFLLRLDLNKDFLIYSPRPPTLSTFKQRKSAFGRE